MAESVPIIPITNINSMSVKPRNIFFLLLVTDRKKEAKLFIKDMHCHGKNRDRKAGRSLLVSFVYISKLVMAGQRFSYYHPHSFKILGLLKKQLHSNRNVNNTLFFDCSQINQRKGVIHEKFALLFTQRYGLPDRHHELIRAFSRVYSAAVGRNQIRISKFEIPGPDPKFDN